MNKSTLFLIISIIAALGCEVTPSKIDYGTDSCHFCKMTIVDQSHAAQVVTTKGKPYKYDAIECLTRSLPQWKPEDLAFILVTDYTTPTKLIDAQSAYYLISEAIPSPMGANLSAFASDDVRKEFYNHSSDKVLNWQELKTNKY